jgi:hypothetical protein
VQLGLSTCVDLRGEGHPAEFVFERCERKVRSEERVTRLRQGHRRPPGTYRVWATTSLFVGAGYQVTIMSSCEALPIVVRATTHASISHTTRAVAEYNARTSGRSVYVVGCWAAAAPNDSAPVLLAPGVYSVGLARHPACSPLFRERHLRNPLARTRLARSMPTWAAVDILTSAAVATHILPHCTATPPRHAPSSRRRDACMAVVVDPDVLLPGDGVQRACEYYDVLSHDSVLLFAPPRARFPSLRSALNASLTAAAATAAARATAAAAARATAAAAAAAASSPAASKATGVSSAQLVDEMEIDADATLLRDAILDMMGSRHVSFLSPAALAALATLSRTVRARPNPRAAGRPRRPRDALTHGARPSEPLAIPFRDASTSPPVSLMTRGRWCPHTT